MYPDDSMKAIAERTGYTSTSSARKAIIRVRSWGATSQTPSHIEMTKL